MMIRLLLNFIVLSLLSAANARAAELLFWQDSEASIALHRGETLPVSYRTLRFDLESLRSELAAVPHEDAVRISDSEFVIALPLPDGSSEQFRIVEAPVMAPALAARYPEIRAYAGQGIDDPTATLRFDVSPRGFHGAVISSSGSYYIDPHAQEGSKAVGSTTYLSYWKKDFDKTNTKVFKELSPAGRGDFTDPKWNDVVRRKLSAADVRTKEAMRRQKTTSGTKLRTYRLALAATGEYTTYHGGTVAGALAAMNTTMVRVNGIYERDVAIRMVLVENTDSLIYSDATTDPYTNEDGSALLDENQTNIDAVIGTDNYDIGHVFGTNGGGLATLGSPCEEGSKAGGTTGMSVPAGDPFDIEYVAHEMGHQFGADHTFNNSCDDNRESSTAYEPGSGTTIMSYAGICSPNTQSSGEDYFHNKSYNEILAFVETTTSTYPDVSYDVNSTETDASLYDWVDVSSTGTEITGLSDESVIGPYDIGFDFPFFGISYTGFYVQSNGLVSFDDGSGVSTCSYANSVIPNADGCDNMIAWMWDDLLPREDSHVYYEVVDGELVIQFVNYGRYNNDVGRINAEAILKSDGQIVIQYHDFQGGIENDSATVGVEYAGGRYGIEVLYNETGLADKAAFLFTPTTLTTCVVVTATDNTPPTITAMPSGSLTLPISTPFELTATASDPDGDTLTYAWEQFDLGPQTADDDDDLTNPSGNQPIFRSWYPSESGTRVFPRLSDLVNNTAVIGELLPTYARDLTFKLTVRDNRAGGGGVTEDTVTYSVTADAGPFTVSNDTTYVRNSTQTITWAVANTDQAPVNASHVDILLSTDGGMTYPTTLASEVPNDGTHDVTIPDIETSTGRIKIKASNHVFFDISDANIVIYLDFDYDEDGLLNSQDPDDDNDGVNDTNDAFPLDATESVDTDSDGIGNNADTDDDGDGVEDGVDVFPLDATETLDTDGDTIGNNADTDDDNDGFSDIDEEEAGTDPLNDSSCPGCFTWDIDSDGQAEALTDGLLVIRHLFGFSGDSLTSGAISGEAERTSADDIAAYLNAADTELDIDGDGEAKALTDGLLLIRSLFGFSGDSLISGAIGNGAERATADAVSAFIEQRMP